MHTYTIKAVGEQIADPVRNEVPVLSITPAYSQNPLQEVVAGPVLVPKNTTNTAA